MQNEGRSVAKIKPFEYDDPQSGLRIAVTVSPRFSVIHVGEKAYYFTRATGEFDGTSWDMEDEEC